MMFDLTENSLPSVKCKTVSMLIYPPLRIHHPQHLSLVLEEIAAIIILLAPLQLKTLFRFSLVIYLLPIDLTAVQISEPAWNNVSVQNSKALINFPCDMLLASHLVLTQEGSQGGQLCQQKQSCFSRKELEERILHSSYNISLPE